MPTCRHCGSEFPNRGEIDGRVRNLSSRRFCLTCSPFGRNNRRRSLCGTKRCPRCERELPLEAFYRRRTHRGVTAYCRECYANIDRQRQRQIKATLVAEAGGSCRRCGYARCLAALEFHHRDPSQKDPLLFRKKHRRLDEATRAELRKCDLLCSNCHRELHDELHLPPPGLPRVAGH